MPSNDLVLLKRKETVGLISAAAWGFGLLLVVISPFDEFKSLGTLAIVLGWAFLAYWVALDALWRGAPRFWWTVFALATGPLGLLFYWVSRPPVPAFCVVCRTALAEQAQVCHVCGQPQFVGAGSAVNRMFSSLTDNFAPGPLKRARSTAMYMAVCFAAVVVLGLLIFPTLSHEFQGYLRAAWIFSFCAYWVLLPWWVYLDAIWRRMEAVPWAILTLLTNVFGLVTYLVVRHPDPQACSQCGQYVPVGSKRCPYCGVEAQVSCPQCQAAVQPDWIYCPSCGAQISTQAVAPARPEPQIGTPRRVSVSGCVRDAASGAPIPAAEVKVDSRTDAKSAVTDAAGSFILEGLEPRPYVLAVSAPGYAPQARAFTPRPGGSVQFCLYPSPEAPNKSE